MIIENETTVYQWSAIMEGEAMEAEDVLAGSGFSDYDVDEMDCLDQIQGELRLSEDYEPGMDEGDQFRPHWYIHTPKTFTDAEKRHTELRKTIRGIRRDAAIYGCGMDDQEELTAALDQLALLEEQWAFLREDSRGEVIELAPSLAQIDAHRCRDGYQSWLGRDEAPPCADELDAQRPEPGDGDE